MELAVIIMEDHLSQHFRPLGWSVPVYEMPVGFFNLRERVELAIRRSDVGVDLGLLPHGLLEALQMISRPRDAAVGAGPCLELSAAADQVLLISARMKGDPSVLSAMIDRDTGPFHWIDQRGFLAWRGPSSIATRQLEIWRDWDQDAATRAAWTTFTAKVPELLFNDLGEASESAEGWGYLFERVHELGDWIRSDLDALAKGDAIFPRSIFGIRAQAESPVWRQESRLSPFESERYPGVHEVNAGDIHLGEGVRIAPGVVLDAAGGPIILDRDVGILANAYLQGPLYIGAGSIVKAGSTIYGETACGAVCRLSGEIAETQLSAFVNKQHAGFLGHAVIGSWVNLGADTTCSDLKNNYGLIKVNYGQGPVDGGSRFIGLMMAEHGKSAIGTTFNTATTVGFSSNVFAPGFPRAVIPNYSWGDGRQKSYDVEKAIDVARIVMDRRGCVFSDAHEALFRSLGPV